MNPGEENMLISVDQTMEIERLEAELAAIAAAQIIKTHQKWWEKRA